ncbi:MAG: hypothetical protein HYT39_01475 [Candidatus Sungbacteria bacterium]|nr:hypothetical protein [Candidatus Sungbacteria bacterium]
MGIDKHGRVSYIMMTRKGEIARLILGILAGAGVVLVAATLPGLAVALKPFARKKNKHLEKQSLERALRRLCQRRLVELVPDRNGNFSLLVTKLGKKHLKKLDFESLKLKIPEYWDGKWSVILFDIPESRKAARNALQRKLKEMGCFQLNKSVLVHPSDCEDEIDFTSEILGIRNYVITFQTTSLGHQEHRALHHFKLKPRS